MGAKDSKPSFISYEDAVKRVPDSELRRIREAFKRCAGANGNSLSLEAFVHEVLCDGVPYEVAEWLYQTSGGTKRGISFRDLLCGIVVLTKGSVEEKIKFLWTLYVNNQNDNGTHLNKWDFASALHLESVSMPPNQAPRIADVLTGLFGLGDKVTFEQFRSWLLIHRDATVLSKWLLEDTVNIAQDLETPTFYQSLAGVTHLEERDIIELEKCFWRLHKCAPSGQLDAEALTPLVAPPLPRAAAAGLLRALDDNRDGHVDFKELCCGLSAACRGPTTERLKFCFKIFDEDRDGVLNSSELAEMVEVLCAVANETLRRAPSPGGEGAGEGEEPQGFDPGAVLQQLSGKLAAAPPANGRRPVFQLGPGPGGEQIVVSNEGSAALTLEDFLIWSVESAEPLVAPLLALLVQVCHVVLGLRPQCPHQERDIVLGWLRREEQRGYSVGQFWYLVGAEWWAAWLAHTAPTAPTAAGDACCRAAPRARQLDEAVVCDDSFTSNSTESMGSLLGRAESRASSLGSASSSGVSSAPPAARAPRPPPARRPGPIDNRHLLQPDLLKVRTLTGEGGHLRRDVTLVQHRDFELLPDALWRALALWYGGPDPLPRQVIRPPNCDVELELYPLHLKLFRHVPSTNRTSTMLGIGGVSVYSSVPLAPAPPERQLAYTAAFSRLATVKQVSEFICGALGLAREDVRLWALGAAPAPVQVLLDDDRPTLHELRLGDRARLLVEVRNPDLTWPEEIGALGGSGRATERRETLVAPNLPGATGLHNLGNTCFMNAALQSVWNTAALTRYFNSGMHLYEVNTTNPLGTKGVLALRFGELCKEVWSCRARSVAPLRVRWCVSRHARALAGGGQHDAQELLAWLLDALHEDLNQAPLQQQQQQEQQHDGDGQPAPAPAPAPAAPRDSDGRPDQVVAAEAWAAHAARNRSILTELFYGQLKSKVRCDACGHESVRFDAFNMLSLPLPMDSYVNCEVRVVLLDGSVPVKYGVRVSSDGACRELKRRLALLCGLPPDAMLVAEVSGATIGRVLEDNARLAAGGAADLTAYETPALEPGDGAPEPDLPDLHDLHDHAEESGAWSCEGEGEGGGGGGAESSRSDLLTSQSPPNTFALSSSNIPYTDLPSGASRCNSLPRGGGGGAGGGGSPTLSAKSLDLAPPSPKLGKVKFMSSPSNMWRMNETKRRPPPGGKIQYLIAVHRKRCGSEGPAVWWQRGAAALFGAPLVVPLRAGLSGRGLYARVWRQVARLLTSRPQRPRHVNHATDCDDSLGYEFPFTLRLVVGAAEGAGGGAGGWCAVCAWPRMCRGCALPADDAPLVFNCGPALGERGRGGRGRRRRRGRAAALERGVPLGRAGPQLAHRQGQVQPAVQFAPLRGPAASAGRGRGRRGGAAAGPVGAARAARAAPGAAGRGLGPHRAAPALPAHQGEGVRGAPVGARVPGGGGARRGPGQLPARLHVGRAARAALPLRQVPRRAARHQEAADMARTARADNPPETFPIREQQVDQVAEGGRLPVRRLRPDAVPGVRAAGDAAAAPRAQESRARRRRGQDIGERVGRGGGRGAGEAPGGEERRRRQLDAPRAARVQQPGGDARAGRRAAGLPAAPPAARPGPLRPQVPPLRGRVAHGPAVRRALRGVRAQPERRVAVLQRQLVPRAAAAGGGRAAAARPRRRLPAVLRAPGAGLRRVPARRARPPRRAAHRRRRPSARRRRRRAAPAVRAHVARGAPVQPWPALPTRTRCSGPNTIKALSFDFPGARIGTR